MEHVKTEGEARAIRGALGSEQNGGGTVSAAEEAALLRSQIAEEEEEATRREAAVRQTGRELAACVTTLQKERENCREQRSRSLIEEATERVLDMSLQVYEEYARRLGQEIERMSFFAQEEEELLALDSELTARSQLLQTMLSAARADEKLVRDSMQADEDEKKTEDVAPVEMMLYDMQRQHIAQFVATQELQAALGPHPSLSAGKKDLALEAAELRASLKVVQAERDKLLQGQSDKLLLMHDVKERIQEVASLQRELKAVQEQIERLLAAAGTARTSLLDLGKEVRSLIQQHMLVLENSFGPLAEELQDSVQRELDCFDQASMSHLLRSSVSPQAAGLPPPLVRDLRIYTSKYVLSSVAAVLEFSPVHSFDHFLEHLQSLASEALGNVNATRDKKSALLNHVDERVTAAFAQEADEINRSVLPVFLRVEKAAQQVEALKEAVEKAFQEWKSLPAQFCIPQEEQRERFMRRYNYLRVLAHDAAKKGQK